MSQEGHGRRPSGPGSVPPRLPNKGTTAEPPERPQATPAPVPAAPLREEARQSREFTPPVLRTTQVTCPSGLTGKIQQMDVDAIDALLDPMLNRSGQNVVKVVQICWIETTDPGPYGLGPNGKILWGNVAQPDLMKVLVEIRRITLGDEYIFRLKCPLKTCHHQIEWGIEISTLTENPMTAEAIASIQSGDQMPFTLPQTGVKVWHHVLTTADAIDVGTPFQSTDQKGWTRKALAKRINVIEGVHTQDKSRWIRGMPYPDQLDFIDEVDRLEGGLDLVFDIECPKCDQEIKVSLAAAQDFLLERSRTKKGKKTSADE